MEVDKKTALSYAPRNRYKTDVEEEDVEDYCYYYYLHVTSFVYIYTFTKNVWRLYTNYTIYLHSLRH